MQAIHVHSERIALGKKTTVPEKNVFVKKIATKPQRPLTRAAKADIKKTSLTGSAVVRNRFKKKDEETAISEAILSSELISSSNENQTEVMNSFNSDSMNLSDSSFNESLTASGKRRSRPVPNIPMEILKDSPIPETSAVSHSLNLILVANALFIYKCNIFTINRVRNQNCLVFNLWLFYFRNDTI